MKRLSLVCCLVLLLSMFCPAMHVHAEETAHVEETAHTEDVALLSEECGESVCGDCGIAYTGDNVSHDWEYEYDEDEHWETCLDCGETTAKYRHGRECGESVCYYCGIAYAGDNVLHFLSWQALQSDDTYHWWYCSECGEACDKEAHVSACDDPTTCTVCAKELPNGSGVVVHHWEGAYEYDENEHWEICLDCGEARDKGTHSSVCDDPTTCTVCAKELSNGSSVIGHHLEGAYEYDENEHWEICLDCGEEIGRYVHQSYCDDLSTCYICDAENVVPTYYAHRTPVNAKNHNVDTHESICEQCGDTFFDYYVKEIKKQVTCTEDGQYIVYCNYCKDDFDIVIKARHSWNTNEDEKVFCARCGEVQGTALTITKLPESVTVASGKQVKVSVKAEGEGLNYQWYVKTAGSDSFKKSSITGATYSVTMNSSRNGNQVYCVVSDKYGYKDQTNTVTLTMATELEITKQPASVEVAAGKTAKVTVTAKGDGLSYQWYVKSVGTSSFKKSSISGSTYSVSMTAARNGNQVYCVVKDKYGNTVQTKTVTISMK